MTTFDPAPIGTHPARLVTTADLGTQETVFGDRHQILLTFELVNEPINEDKNFHVSKFFTASLAKNAGLRAVITALTGAEPTEIDIKELLGFPCFVTITHSYKESNTFANIQSITAAPKGMQIPEAKAPLIGYDMDDPSDDSYEKLPDWVKKRISYAKPTKTKPLNTDEGITTGIHARLSTERLPF